MTDSGTQIILDKKLISSFAPRRPKDGHKYTFGMAVIVAGSKSMMGAQEIATTAALRSGVGLVKVLAPEDSLLSTRINCPCAMTAVFPDSETELIKLADSLLQKATCVAIGPGLDESSKQVHVLLRFFLMNAKSLVIDASALNLISKNRLELIPLLKQREESGLKPCILTPHLGEFLRLIGQEDSNLSQIEIEAKCVEFSIKNRCFVVLKGHETMISTPHGGRYRNYIGNNGMAKGGSGDFLTGLIAGLVAQGISEEIAAASGVYFHALTGDVTAGILGKRAMLPSDMFEYLPAVFEGMGW